MSEELIGTDKLLTPIEAGILAAVLNVIIPASEDGRRPGAADVGILENLAELSDEQLHQLRAESIELDEFSRDRKGDTFTALDYSAQLELVEELRARQPGFMMTLAGLAMSRYYRDDRVLDALGMGSGAPYPDGYTVLPGDLSLLEPVKKRGKRYRDV